MTTTPTEGRRSVGGTGLGNRLAAAFKRAGGLPKEFCRCPECKGPAVLDDCAPVMKPRYRYSITCKEHDCVMVMASSVRKALALWREEHTTQTP